ncbi:MAG: outer membrane lipid asymmetry maintenance protein MlaD [Alphaproteobacteria bacterium]
MTSKAIETLTGGAVICIAIIFFVYAYQAVTLKSASGSYTVLAEFGQVNGISTGSDVRLSGIKVGTVVGQKLNPETFQAILTLSIVPTVRLPEDSSAKITSDGLLGGNYVSLQPGGAENLLAEGDAIQYTQSAVDLMSLIGQALFGGKDK